jgi:uncharacterized protein (DUF1810 family)
MLNRFVAAQDGGIYKKALAEIQSGEKKSHWMWFIFPQLKGLGQSYTANYYAIKNKEMAGQYLNHPILGPRLIETSQAVYDLNANNIVDVFGYPDYLKFQSCMTLFSIVAPEIEIFKANLMRYFGGEMCRFTEFNL